MSFSPGVVSALSDADLHSIYNDSVWYRVGGGLIGEGFTCGGAGDGTLDSFLKALAYGESGGNPTAENPSGASGKYQYLTETWQSVTKDYYPPANQYPRALNAPESYQDAVTYILNALRSKQTNGDIFKMAVAHYYPLANQKPEYLDIVPQGNILTPRQYANQLIQYITSPKAQAIPLKYAEAPSFQQFLAKVGGSSTLSGVGCTCSSAIVAMAKNYAWPTYSKFLLDLKPPYEAAIKQPGVYVGGPPPGVDCGAYVTRAMIDSGADPGYNYGGKYSTGAGNTATQKKYLDEQVAAGKYINLGTVNNTSKLQPGDIAITANTHTYLFLGDQGFKGYDSASSSQGERAPMASNSYFTDTNRVPFTWYRLKCSANSLVQGAI